PVLCCGGFWVFGRKLSEGPPLIVVGNNPPPPDGPPNPPPDPGPGGGKPPPAAPAWDVKPDPGTRPPVRGANPSKRFPLGGRQPQIIIAPSTPGPFVASGTNLIPQDKREVWNLETMEKVGEISGYRLSTPGVLSPDGAYLAGWLNQANAAFA